jgi:hypothetical protein
LSADANWYHCFDPAVFHRCANGQDHETTNEGGVESSRGHGRGLQVDGGVRSSGIAALESESWVSLDWKRHVGAGASSNESGRNGVDSVQAHWGAEDVGHWDLADCTAGSRLVKSLGDKNGASRGEVRLARDVRGGTKICGNSNAFNDGSQGDEFLGSRHWELVSTSFDRFGSSSGQASLEVENVTFLVMRDVLELIVEAGWETGGSELVNAPLGQGVLVEGVLEMLKLDAVSDWKVGGIASLTVKAY